tara:strand:- start:387 stop:2591 length:2205 start_codon:yes stop_codon:yes gene_type:complete
MEIFQNISLGKSLKEPREVTRVPGKVGSVLPMYSKVNKDKIVGYVLDMKMPKARGKSKGRLVEYYGIKEYGDIASAKAAAEGQYQKIILDPKYRELMTDKLLVDRDSVVRSFLNHLENVDEFDGYEKMAPELKYLQSDSIDHRYEKINKYFRGWLNKDFEVEGIDRKDLTKEAKKELKNWNPQARGERTKVREQRMQFMDELNNRDISLAQAKKEFKKKFSKGKYYNEEMTFRQTVNQFTQLKREGSLPTNADGSRTLSYGVEAGERSPWLKKALSENVTNSGNYARLITAADEARTKGNLTRAKTLEDTATRFFGTKGIFTKLGGNAEHPLSYTYGGKDNILKMDSLVRGDLNQTKRVLFDNPIRDLKNEYNVSTTTAKRKKEIRTAMEGRKAFMNYLTSGTFDKGMAESVNFDFTPKKVYLSSTVTPLDKLPKDYDFKKFVKKGKEYQKSFQKVGGKLGMVTKSGFSKRVAMSDKNLAEQLRKAGFKCKFSAQSGGLSRCDDPMNYIDDIKRNQRLALSGSPKAKARSLSKFRAVKSFISGTLGPGAIAFEAAVAAPFALYGYGTGADKDEIISDLTFGIGGRSIEERMKEKYGEDVYAPREFLDMGDRLSNLERLQGGTKGQRIRSKGKFDRLQPQFQELGKKMGYTDEQGLVTEEGARKYIQDSVELQNREIEDAMIKAERAKERKDDLTGLEGIGMKSGGLMNLTRTTPPKRSLNKDSQGLASLPEYDR